MALNSAKRMRKSYVSWTGRIRSTARSRLLCPGPRAIPTPLLPKSWSAGLLSKGLRCACKCGRIEIVVIDTLEESTPGCDRYAGALRPVEEVAVDGVHPVIAWRTTNGVSYKIRGASGRDIYGATAPFCITSPCHSYKLVSAVRVHPAGSPGVVVPPSHPMRLVSATGVRQEIRIA